MIAISYRREDSLPIAGRLYDRLQAKFGKKSVFMDFDSIPPGADFRQHIKQMIERSKLVIAIIGPHWLGEQPDASRRIDNPADFVRLEIAYALEGGIPVIPLLINTTQMPKPEMLPPDIQELAFRHALPLDSGMDFHSHVDRLIAGIGKATDAARKRRHFVADSEKTRPASPTTHAPRTSFGSEESKRKLITWTRSKLLVGTAVALLFAVAALAAWYVATHRREPTKQVATSKEPNRASAESATTPPLIIKPSVEQSVSPLSVGSQAPKETALTTAPSPTAVELLIGGQAHDAAKRLEGEEKAASSPASTASQTQPDNRPVYVVIATESKLLNLRLDHSAKSTVIEKLRSGDRVFLEEGRVRNDDPPHPTTWQEVTTMNGDTGWIALNYLAPSKDANQSSTPVVSESPASAPATEDAEVRRLFEKWLSVSNAGDTEQEASLYAEPADYLDFRMLSRQELVQELQRDLQRWPKHHYTVSKGPLVEKLSGSEWRVTFAINFDVRDSSKGKQVTGTANLTWLIRRRESGELEIASSKEQVTSSTWHDIKRGGPPAQISPSQPTNAPSATPQPASSIESATPEIRKAKPVLSASPQQLVQVYVKKYGVSALFPTDVFPDAKKLSNSDQSFLQGNSWTGQTTLTFSSVREPLAKVYAECATEHSPQAPSKTVQYKVLKPTWFVVSGDLGPDADASLGFYTKGVKKNGIVVIMHFQWREDDFPFSEETFTAMSRGFDGN